MRVSQRDHQNILDQADIVDIISRYVPLDKKGKEYVGVCPFHDDHSPSMHVSLDKQIYKCFACGAGGNVIKFVSEIEKITYQDALIKVAELIHYPLQLIHEPQKTKDPNQPLYDALRLFTAYGKYELNSPDGLQASQYLAERKFSKQIIDDFDIGYVPSFDMVSQYLQARIKDRDVLEQTGLIVAGESSYIPYFYERILIPIHDANGQPVGYTARILPGSSKKAKYVNTTTTVLYEKSHLIFNYHRAKKYAAKAGRVILCEGAMDVLGLAKAGMYEGIANLGTACTPMQLDLIANLHVPVVVFYDQDSAGQKAAWNFAQAAFKAGIRFSFVHTTQAKDPDDIFIEKGAEALQQAVNSTISYAEFAFDYLQTQYNLQNYEDKKQYAKLMEEIIRNSLEQYEQPVMFDRLKELTGYSFEKEHSSWQPKKAGHQFAQPIVTPPVEPGHDHAEKSVLWCMLRSDQFIDQYNEQVGVFTNPTCMTLFKYLQLFYKQHSTIDPLSLFEVIEESDVKHLFLELADWPDYSDMIDQLFNDSKKKILKDVIENQINAINTQIKQVKNPLELKDLLIKKRDLVCRKNQI